MNRVLDKPSTPTLRRTTPSESAAACASNRQCATNGQAPPVARLLIVDDESAQLKALCTTLEAEGYRTSGFTSPNAALAVLREREFDVVLSDLMMPEMGGIALMRAATEIDPNLVGIVMTGHGAIDTAVQAMQAGAHDYILKPFKLSAVLPALTRALAVRRLRMDNIRLQEAVGIYRLSMAVAFTFDLDAVLQKVADAALLQSQARGISIWLPTEDSNELRVAIACGEDLVSVQGVCIPFSAALCDWVQRSRELLSHADDLAEVHPVSGTQVQGIPRGICIPMLAGGAFVGILNVNSEHPCRPIAPGQLKALHILAGAAASAIERAALIERLRHAEQRYRRLTENAPDIVFRYELDPRPAFTYVNPAITAITGYAPEEYYADPDLGLKIAHPDDRPLMERVLRGYSPNGSAVILRFLHRNGNVIWVEQRNMLVQGPHGRLVAVEVIARDITERKLADEQIRRSLQEKDVMLNEIHHRVKNNLQVVSSLLSLQADQIQDPVARRMFTDSQNRIQSMALIHQQLYTSSDFAEIDFGAYLRSLADHVLASYAGNAASFGVSVDATDAFLSLAEAIPCGLIVNELLSNSLKHSFHHRSGGEIRVGFGASDGICRLTVDDDGSPLPDDILANRPPTMGVRLVQALTSQLGGDLRVGRGPKFEITFPGQRAGAS
jgi:PAS domain S-box-containing protein